MKALSPSLALIALLWVVATSACSKAAGDKERAAQGEFAAMPLAGLRSMAEVGHARAQHELGERYAKGEGGALKDEKEAVSWYLKAALQGDAEAQFNLGLCHVYGAGGLEQDEQEAVTWWRKAARQGDVDAQFYLGRSYYLGQGVKKDLLVAMKWWRQAALQGDAFAQYYLGLCYAEGQGVAKDEVEAYKWYLLAAARGHIHARAGKGDLEKTLTATDRKEGQKLAKAWQVQIKAQEAAKP